MGMSKTTQRDDLTLNSTEVTDLESAHAALDYLTEDYNNGTLSWAVGKSVLVVVARGQRFQHHGFFRDHPGIEIINPAGIKNSETGQAHLKLELQEVEDGTA